MHSVSVWLMLAMEIYINFLDTGAPASDETIRLFCFFLEQYILLGRESLSILTKESSATLFDCIPKHVRGIAISQREVGVSSELTSDHFNGSVQPREPFDAHVLYIQIVFTIYEIKTRNS